MKKVVVDLQDNIANSISAEAAQLGLTQEEMLRVIIGEWAVRGLPRAGVPFVAGVGLPIAAAPVDQWAKEIMKVSARVGSLKCRRCTMALTEKDVDDNKCHACGYPVLGESSDTDRGGDQPEGGE
jgi:hypothetical protein